MVQQGNEQVKITASLQDLMTAELRAIEQQLARTSREVDEASDKLSEMEAAERRLANEVRAAAQAERQKAVELYNAAKVATETTRKALLEAKARESAAIKETNIKRKALAEQQQAERAAFQALRQRREELLLGAEDVARSAGASLGPLSALSRAAGPIAAVTATVAGLAQAFSAVRASSLALDAALKPSASRIGQGQFAELRDDIRELSSATGLAAEEVAAGVNAIFTNTSARTTKAVGELLKQSTLLAKTGFGSVAEAATALDGVLGALNLRVEDSATASAVLATSANRAGVPIATFAAALEQSGPLARQFGLSLQDLSALLVSVKAQGIGLGDASNAIRSLLTVFSDEGNATRKSLEAIGINFKAASKDGKGFANILGQIAEATRGQPELLNALFPGGAQQLTRIFAAVEGASANFRTELERTGKAAQDFAQLVENSTSTAGGFFSRFFNEATNQAAGFWEDFSDSFSIGVANLTGNLDLAEAELKRAAERLGLSVDFRSSPVIQDLGDKFGASLKEAIQANDIEAALRVRINLEETGKFIEGQVRELGKSLAGSAALRGLGEDAVSAQQLKDSLLFKSLQLSDADAEIVSDRLSKAYQKIIADIPAKLKADNSAAGRARVGEIISQGLTEGLQSSIKGLGLLPQEIARLTAQANAELSKLGYGTDGQPIIARLASPEQTAGVRNLISSLSEATALYAKETEALASRIVQDAVPAQQKQLAALDAQIAQIDEVRAQYEAEGRDAGTLVQALTQLAAKRREVAGIQDANPAASNFTNFLTAAAVQATKAAQTGAAVAIQLEAEATIKADAAKLAAEVADAQAALARDAQLIADSRESVLRLVLTPQIEFEAEQVNAVTLEALAPLADQLRAVQEQFQAGAISGAEFRAEMARIREEGIQVRQSIVGEGDFASAFSESLEQIRSQMADTQLQAQGFAQDLSSGLVSSFETLFLNISKGEEGFKAFGKALASMVQQAIAKLLALKLASSFLNILGLGGGGGLGAGSGFDTGSGIPFSPPALAKGGIIHGRMSAAQSLGVEASSHWRSIGNKIKAGAPVQAYAQGGVARSPQVAVFGEGGGAEAFVPLPGPNRGIPVEFKDSPVMRSRRGEGGEPVQNTVNVTLSVASLDPRTAADVVLAQMPQIQRAIASALQGGRDRGLLSAVRGAAR